MPMFPAASRRRFAPGISSVPALLATTSVAALLLGTPLPAHAGGISVTTNTNKVDNPANTAVTSIVINGVTVTGTVTNEGTVSPGKGPIPVAGLFVNVSTIGAGIANSGTIAVDGTLGPGVKSGFGAGILAFNSTISAGGISNTNTITVTNAATAAGIAVSPVGILFVVPTTVAGGLSNSGSMTVTAVNSAFGLEVILGTNGASHRSGGGSCG
jgi:hypothetical protein